ncbi:MAG: ribonuclease HII [Treponema sp.]|jgi:ribonuclease HII|nr:ribonuclease HII [Treponema sp.]
MLCGIDEAGRGPLAGPVCAATAVLPGDFPREVLRDSKKLTPPRREAARVLICEKALAWGIGWASAAEIDEINILQASLLAMERAFRAMTLAFPAVIPGRPVPGEIPPDGPEAVVDGLYVPRLPIPCRALVKADNLIPAVMAASILAKTARDRMMERYSWLYPQYGYEKHKGYPTREHRENLARYGPSPIPRKSFSF